MGQLEFGIKTSPCHEHEAEPLALDGEKARLALPYALDWLDGEACIPVEETKAGTELATTAAEADYQSWGQELFTQWLQSALTDPRSREEFAPVVEWVAHQLLQKG